MYDSREALNKASDSPKVGLNQIEEVSLASIASAHQPRSLHVSLHPWKHWLPRRDLGLGVQVYKILAEPFFWGDFVVKIRVAAGAL